MALPLLLKQKPNSKSLKSHSIIHFFSTSDPNGKPQTPASATEDADTSSSSEQSRTTGSQSAFSSYLNEVKANLKNQQKQSLPNSQPFQLRTPTSSSIASTDSVHHKSTLKDVPLEEIRKNLSTFRRLSVGPPADSNARPSSTSSSPSSEQQISFEELYKRNVSGKSDETTGKAEMTPGKVGGAMSYDQIRESLRNVAKNARRNVSGDQMSWPITNRFRLPSDGVQNSKMVGGRDALPKSVFGREMMEKKEGDKSTATKTELLGMYSYGRLGQRLMELRPKEKEGDWFSFQELNERLSKLREVEEKEAANDQFKVLRDTMVALNAIGKDKPQKRTLQGFDIHGLVRRGRTPDFMLKPPKEHLVEKFFHPDNMSSAEKLKIELAKVREEFKMSESDCGSARVQVAQLTTKIKHLSSLLHKKDKHSRKGLEEMVQRRKKLLKYLRRTDWDSYCFVISKLGLRDNPISRA